MAGQLIQVATNTVTTPVSSVTLTGIDSDDVYMVSYNNVTPTTNGDRVDFRVTVSGTADTTANYDFAEKFLSVGGGFFNGYNTNVTSYLMAAQQVATGISNNGIMHLFNLNNASEYSFLTNENAFFWTGTLALLGQQGGLVHTVAQSCDGVHFFATGSSNIESGTFTLFKCL